MTNEGAFLRETWTMPLRLPAGWWALVLAITAGTNFLDFVAAAQPDARGSPLFAVAMALRVALVFWIGYALVRRLAEVTAPMRITMAFLRFTLFGIGLIAVMALCAWLAKQAAGPSMLTQMILTYGILTLIVMALAPLYGWQAALAIGDRSLGPGGMWRALAPDHAALAAVYLSILPVAFVHAILTFIALEAEGTAWLASLALVDGIVSTAQLALTSSLAVAAWRRASAATLHEGAPAA